jgi:hypothetical protein
MHSFVYGFFFWGGGVLPERFGCLLFCMPNCPEVSRMDLPHMSPIGRKTGILIGGESLKDRVFAFFGFCGVKTGLDGLSAVVSVRFPWNLFLQEPFSLVGRSKITSC